MFSPSRLQLERVTVIREKDEFANGCLPGTIERVPYEVGPGMVFNATEEMFEAVRDITMIDIPMEDIALQVSNGDAVGSGTVILQCHVNDNGEYRSEAEVESWMKGETTLWLCDILLQVSLVKRSIDTRELQRFMEMDLVEATDEDWVIN